MKSVLALTAVALLSASTLVLADPGHGGGRGAFLERLKTADTNGDGLLSRTEAAALPRIADHFDAIDANKDGQISFEELRAARQAHRAKHRLLGPDGKITRDAFLARAAARFDRLDANKDGVVTADELKAARGARHGS